jgi:hypothetical protein
MLILIPRGSWPIIAADLRDVLNDWHASIAYERGRPISDPTNPAYLVAQDAILERAIWSDARDFKEARARFKRDEGTVITMHSTRIVQLVVTATYPAFVFLGGRTKTKRKPVLGWRQLFPKTRRRATASAFADCEMRTHVIIDDPFMNTPTENEKT